MDQFHESNRINAGCAAAIDKAIVECNYELYHYDLVAALKSVTAEYGPERVNGVLASSINSRSYDGRFSQANKAWAKENDVLAGIKPDFMLQTHPAVLDGFANRVRESGHPLPAHEQLQVAKDAAAQQESRARETSHGKDGPEI